MPTSNAAGSAGWMAATVLSKAWKCCCSYLRSLLCSTAASGETELSLAL